jgi:hypothetical protein
MSSGLLPLVLGAVLLCGPSEAAATTGAAQIFCQQYPAALGCVSQESSCSICHAGPPAFNAYGQAVKEHLSGGLEDTLIAALDKTGAQDSDADGFSNLDEIVNDSAPGLADVVPTGDVGLVYDVNVAFKRVKAVYCGESATFAEMEKLKAAANPTALLHEQLGACLEGSFWKNEALHRLADRKIQPLAAVGFGGNVVIGDYRFDYRLFSYVMSGDRDVRELLSAQYHIDEAGRPVQGVIAREEPFQLGQRIVIAGGQPLAPARRAGMMTTQWFLSTNTMFASLPRNSASQVYRAYLGLDIAKGEGLAPVDGEPRDVDRRRVAQPECAVCHSTLDPLAYAFSTYKGIEVGIGLALGNPIGTYDPARTSWEGDGQILGQQASDLLEWAEIARNSEAFRRNIARMMFEQALSRGPLPHEKDEFDALWQGLPAEGYSVNKMLHRMIDTKAFGGRRS